MSENKFQIGDRIRVVSGHETWLDRGQPYDSIFTAVLDNGPDVDVFCEVTWQVGIETLNAWPDDFELVERPVFIPTSVVNDSTVLRTGGFTTSASPPYLVGEAGTDFVVTKERAENMGNRQPMLGDSKEVIIPIVRDKAESLGIHRPALEDRKVGKVGMHMVIDGFPRALREVARVMTWAESEKGYKLHDWVNLPNAEVEFPAAEYRHQNDNSIMKSEGTPAIERTDHESNLLHAAHKVFNSLAELELILQGKIK